MDFDLTLLFQYSRKVFHLDLSMLPWNCFWYAFFGKIFFCFFLLLIFCWKDLVLSSCCFSNLETESPDLIPHVVLFTLPFFKVIFFCLPLTLRYYPISLPKKKPRFNTFTFARLTCQFLLLPKILNHSIDIQLFAYVMHCSCSDFFLYWGCFVLCLFLLL